MTQPQGQPVPPVEDEVKVFDASEGPMALASIDRASIDIQIATARAFPRSVSKALAEVESLALLDEETAASMFYALPRGKNDDGSKKFIEGPSVRLAELIAYSWSNLRVDSGIIAVETRALTAQSTCFDLEKNVAVRVQVKRSIWGNRGRFNDDMIGVTSQAAISIALRNAVFRVVPRVYIDRVYEKARLVALGDTGSFAKKRDNAIAWFKKVGIEVAQLYEVLGIRGFEDLQGDQYIQLQGIANAIKTGEATLESTFGKVKEKTDGATALNEALKAKVEPAPAPPAPTEESEDERAARLAEDAKLAQG